MPRFQFSLRWLMVAITAAAFVLFFAVSFGGFIEVVILSLLWCVLPTPLLMFAIYARGDLQAFAIGALVPWVMMIVLRFMEISSLFAAAVWLLPMCAMCGVVGAATRRWIEANLGK